MRQTFIGFVSGEKLLVFILTIVRVYDVDFRVAVKNEPLELAPEIELNLNLSLSLRCAFNTS